MEIPSIPKYKGQSRSELPEIMDDLELSGKELEAALHEIARINRLLGGYRSVCSGVQKFLQAQQRPFAPGFVLNILDIGSGAGDIPARLAADLNRVGIKHRIVALDANPAVIAFARKNYPASSVEYQVGNAFEVSAFEPHIITSSLFFHHFSEENLQKLVKTWENQVQWGWVINDLERSPWAYRAFQLFTRFMRVHPMARYDGSVSILRSFTQNELNSVFSTYLTDIKRMPIFRWRLLAFKTAPHA